MLGFFIINIFMFVDIKFDSIYKTYILYIFVEEREREKERKNKIEVPTNWIIIWMILYGFNSRNKKKIV